MIKYRPATFITSILTTMGYDPDLIRPGQELILIRFSSDEIKQIYQFFAEATQQYNRNLCYRSLMIVEIILILIVLGIIAFAWWFPFE